MREIIFSGIGRGLALLLIIAILLWLGRRGWAWLRYASGDDAYERYLERFRAHGHAGKPMTRKEFWKDRIDRRDGGPRCC